MRRALLAYLLAASASASGCQCDRPKQTPGGVLCPASPCPTDGGTCRHATCTDELCGFAFDDPGAPCDGGVCAEDASCTACRVDGVRDDQETGIDCGGPGCPACANGMGCKQNADCLSNSCSAAGHCTTAQCNNQRQDGSETDVDCGGPDCEMQCPAGEMCLLDRDCAPTDGSDGGACKDGRCCAVPCDGRCQTCAAVTGACTFVLDGGSAGGRCPGEGDACDGRGDCVGCVDKTKNGPETDFDCGGGVCPGCPDGGACNTGTDCASCTCAGGQCVPPACNDKVKDGCETDVDCGGPCGATCGLGMSCLVKGDCLSNDCVGGRCALP